MPFEQKLDEPDLISLLKDGDEGAFSYLYDHYSAALFGIILKIISKEEVAEDVLQEVFVKIYTHIKHYDSSRGRLYTWLLQITRNTAIDMVRSKDFKKAHVIRELNNNVNDSASNSSAASYDSIGLDKVLSGLSEDQRKIVDLSYYKGFTQEEISNELNVPLGTVKSRARSALVQLRKLLNLS